MKELKEKEHMDTKNTLFPGNMGDLFGVPFQIHIQPYLKKIKIVDIPDFQFNFGGFEFENEQSPAALGWKPYMMGLGVKK